MISSSCTLQLPLIATWKYMIMLQSGLAFLLAIPLGVLLYCTPAKSLIRRILSLSVAVAIPHQLPTIVSSLSPEETHWMGLFVVSCIGFATFFKSVAVAFEQYPQGADKDLKTFLCWYISFTEPVIAKGKLRRLVPQEVLHRTGLLILKILALSFLLSFFRSLGLYPSDYFGVSEMWHAPIINGFVHVWFIYFFLGFSIDFAILFYSLIFGASLGPGFRNPLLASRTLRECWGIRWNLSVQTLLKRNVYIPARKAGMGRETATISTFLASGLLHEYTFSIHNAKSYQPGEATLFFVMMGVTILVEGLILNATSERMQTLAYRIPSPIISTTAVLLVAAGPFDTLFIRSWLQSGVIDATSEMFPHILCEATQ
jgi:hypothetical protein